MINTIWFFMIFIGIVLSFIKGNTAAVMDASLKGAANAVELTIGLIGVMGVWCGVMKIAEKSGLTEAIGKIMHPFMRLIFPDIPKRHPAMGAIILNISSNAATPLGIKAMEEMQKLNNNKDRATDSMVMFLVINSACIQIIPSTVISIRSSAGSKNPSEIIITTLIATAMAGLVGIISCKMLERYYE